MVLSRTHNGMCPCPCRTSVSLPCPFSSSTVSKMLSPGRWSSWLYCTMKCTSRTSQGICTQRPGRTALASWAIFLQQHGIKLVINFILSNRMRRTGLFIVYTSTGSCCSNFQQQNNDAEKVTHVTCKPKNIHDFKQVLLPRKWGCNSHSSYVFPLQVLRPTVDTNDCYDEGFFYPCNGPEFLEYNFIFDWN